MECENINIKSKKCIEFGCKIIPTFNKEGETKGLYCSVHKKEGMVNVTIKTCIEDLFRPVHIKYMNTLNRNSILKQEK